MCVLVWLFTATGKDLFENPDADSHPGADRGFAVALLGTHQGMVAHLPAPSADWLWMAGALSVCFLVGNLALQYGAARLTAHTTALIMLSEVVFASVSSVVLGAASLTLQTVAGGSLILLAAVQASRASSPGNH